MLLVFRNLIASTNKKKREKGQMKTSYFLKSESRLRLRGIVGVGENLWTPAPTPTPGKNTDSGRLRSTPQPCL